MHEIKTALNKYTLIAALMLFFVIGVATAIIISQYEIAVEGILGLVVMYLMFRYIRLSRTDVSIGALLLEPNKTKYFIFAILGPLISYLATMKIVEMIEFILKRKP